MEEQILEFINTWRERCYSVDIPDEAPEEIKDMVPSYKRIAMSILRNDQGKSLGFTLKQSKWYDHYKKIEIEQRKNK